MNTYKLNKGFIFQKLDNKMTIFDWEESVLYTFNETASYIFEKIKKKSGYEKIILDLMKKYGIKKEKAHQDFNNLVKELVQKKIITINTK